MEGKGESGAVLAFLLGTARTLKLDDARPQVPASSNSSSAPSNMEEKRLLPRAADANNSSDPGATMLASEDDALALTPIPGCRETQADTGTRSTRPEEHVPGLEETASDWDALTSCESEDEPAVESACHDAEPVEQRPEAPNKPTDEVPPATSTAGSSHSDAEVESEDDCAVHANTTVEPGVGKSSQALVDHDASSRGNASQPAMTPVPGAREENVQDTSSQEHATSSPSVLAPVSAKPPKKTATKDAATFPPPTTAKQPTLEEFLFVGCVATMLLAYLCACVYSFFHPLHVPFPDHVAFHSAVDMSNVSVAITNPANDSRVTPLGVTLEWELANFPVAALRDFGAEVFQYRVRLDEALVASEFGFLAQSKTPATPGAATFNETVRFFVPAHNFASAHRNEDADDIEKRFKLHLAVDLPVPGLLGELQTFELVVYVRDAAPVSAHQELQLQIDAPADGASFAFGQSVLLEYTAEKVATLEVVVDGVFWLRKSHASDGRLLVRGLGAGMHALELRALDERGEALAASAVRVKIMDESTA